MNPASTIVARVSGFGKKNTIEVSSVLKSSVALGPALSLPRKNAEPSH
jgi:hypothetical protein